MSEEFVFIREVKVQFVATVLLCKAAKLMQEGSHGIDLLGFKGCRLLYHQGTQLTQATVLYVYTGNQLQGDVCGHDLSCEYYLLHP